MDFNGSGVQETGKGGPTRKEVNQVSYGFPPGFKDLKGLPWMVPHQDGRGSQKGESRGTFTLPPILWNRDSSAMCSTRYGCGVLRPRRPQWEG